MVAIVTGASDGIGVQTAQMLARKGYSVHGLARSEKQFTFMEYHQVDVSDKEALEKTLNDIYEKEGNVDLLACCAGVSLASPAELTQPEDARYLFEVNFWGCVYASSYVLQRMKKHRRGRIVFVASLTGFTAIPYLSFYSASKAALLAYAGALAGEAKAFHVSVGAIAPGGVKTGFTKKRKKYLDYEDDARAPGLRKAITAISAVEQHGIKPEQVAKKIISLASRRHMPVYSTAGIENYIIYLMLRILPRDCIQFALRKVFSV